jgi:lysyl oxidase-like protein 2/3/4
MSRYGLRNAVVGSESLLNPGLASLAWPNASGELQRVDADARFDAALLSFFDIDGKHGRTALPRPFNLSTAGINTDGLAKWDQLSVADHVDQLLSAKTIDQEQALYLIAYMGSLSLQPDPKKIGFVECWRWFALPGHTVEGLVEAGGVWKLKYGMSHILGLVLDDIKAATGTKVTWIFDRVVSGVTESGDVLKLTTGLNPLADASPTNPAHSITYTARSSILTIPHNVLDKVTFNPPLSPLKSAAIADKHSGLGVKLIAHASPSSGIPPTASGFAVGPSGKPPGFYMTMGDKKTGSGGALLVGFGASPELTASFPSVYTPDAKHNSDFTIRELFAAFPDLSAFGNPSAPIDGYTLHPHTTDPYSRGTWSFHGPQFWSSGHDRALREKHGRVWFASGDYSEGWKGFVDGAIEMGMGTGREVAGFLKMDEV